MGWHEIVVTEDNMVCSVVTIEGDRFLLTLPTKRILDKLHDETSLFYDFQYQFYVDDPCLVFCQGLREKPIGKMVGDKLGPVKDETNWEFLFDDTRMLWRPCLVPLNRKNERDDSFFRQNPEKSVFTGGAFLMDGVGYGESWSTWNVPLLDTDVLEAGIGDVPEAGLKHDSPPISWICVDGCLVAQSVVAVGCLKDLNQQGLLPYMMEEKA